jgi:drug/metabolite transporter (DMT)-like permease
MRLTDYDPMVVAAGSLLYGGVVLLPFALVIDHPWTLRPTAEALAATVAMGIFLQRLGLMLFYMCLTRLGTLTTNAQGYLRIPIGVGLLGAAARRTRPGQSRTRPRSRHGRRRRHDNPERRLPTVAAS